MDDLLGTLGLCKRAGRLEAGEEPAGTACQRRKCRLLLVAEDAAENTVRRAEHLAGTGGCLCAQVPYSKEVLGQALGRSPCALLAVTDAGLAGTLLRRLAASDPDRWAEAAEAMEQKAEKIQIRKKKKPRRRG